MAIVVGTLAVIVGSIAGVLGFTLGQRDAPPLPVINIHLPSSCN
jgi:hypothetical protein